MIFCFLNQSSAISKEEMNTIQQNDQAIAKLGRKPGLELIYNGNKLTVQQWGSEIINVMIEIAKEIDNSNETIYIR